MKQKLLIFGALFLIIAAMILLNAATYVQKPTMPDTEESANRSSFNAGSTGTKALYQLLAESGSDVSRWQEDASKLGTFGEGGRPAVFVMAGPFRRTVTEPESIAILDWVASGGRLVLIDRQPVQSLLATTSSWSISIDRRNEYQEIGVDPADVRQMTKDSAAVRPNSVTSANLGVNAVQLSRFGSLIVLRRRPEHELPEVYTGDATDNDIPGDEDYVSVPPKPEGSPAVEQEPPPLVKEPIPAAWLKGPIVHLSDTEGVVAAELPYGAGRIFLIADPYIVANGGISNADNVRFALNVIDSGGLIAFDEYHHGFGSGQNKMVEYFSGTPIVAIFLQIGMIVALVFFSQSRRFGRPVPEPEPDRLSKLEYVSAIAELQRRTRAYDLALENIYGDLRRRAARLFGVDATTTSRRELAERIAERIGSDIDEIDGFLAECEAAIHGGRINEKRAIMLVARIREIESRLSLMRPSGGIGR